MEYYVRSLSPRRCLFKLSINSAERFNNKSNPGLITSDDFWRRGDGCLFIVLRFLQGGFVGRKFLLRRPLLSPPPLPLDPLFPSFAFVNKKLPTGLAQDNVNVDTASLRPSSDTFCFNRCSTEGRITVAKGVFLPKGNYSNNIHIISNKLCSDQIFLSV